MIKIRSEIVDKSEKSPNYLTDDLNRIKYNNTWIEAVINNAKDEQDAIRRLDNILKWRKGEANKNYTDESFPLEIYKISYLNFLDIDSQGRSIFLINLSHWRKTLAKFAELMKEYLIYMCEKVVIRQTNSKVVLIYDGQDIHLNNVDLDLLTFYIEITQKYYPFLDYHMIGVNIPELAESGEKLIRAIANRRQNELISHD